MTPPVAHVPSVEIVREVASGGCEGVCHARPRFGGEQVRAGRRRRARRGLACLGVLAAIVVAGCGGGTPDDPVKRAEAKVTQKQAALDDAKATFEKASTTACSSVGSYIVAIDRYGDVLNATATTVGDVRDAGTDLSAPKADATAAAEAAVAAQQDVVEAKNELADAEAELEQARSGATPSGAAASSPSSATAKPLAPAATVERVKAAEADFTSAQKGVTPSTPLAQASQEFNAAAVSLELSWLRLFADAGCLTDEQQQQAETAVRTYATALQKSLAEAGYYDGKVDGVYGSSTVEAVKALQKAHNLPVTGTVYKATDAALQAELQKVGGAAPKDAVATTAAVQQTLKLTGF